MLTVLPTANCALGSPEKHDRKRPHDPASIPEDRHEIGQKLCAGGKSAGLKSGEGVRRADAKRCRIIAHDPIGPEEGSTFEAGEGGAAGHTRCRKGKVGHQPPAHRHQVRRRPACFLLSSTPFVLTKTLSQVSVVPCWLSRELHPQRKLSRNPHCRLPPHSFSETIGPFYNSIPPLHFYQEETPCYLSCTFVSASLR